MILRNKKFKGRKFLVVTLMMFLSLCSILIYAQETLVVGQVLNGTDKTALPNVNIYFKNSGKGVQSNEEGYFMIRTSDNFNTLVFSAVGFKQKTMHIKPGQSVGLQVELDEANTLLQDIFVLPGVNPALNIMKKVRLLRNENDLSKYSNYQVKSTEQNLVLLSKVNQRSFSTKIFKQLQKGALNASDSSLAVPLYMEESEYLNTENSKTRLSNNTFSSPEIGEKIIEKLVGNLDVKLNFYDNSVSVFGKNLISPLSSMGNAYYFFFLADSSVVNKRKQYEIHFRTKNTKNLAFNGQCWIDSATYALTAIEAELPAQANINYVRDLYFSQKFKLETNNFWSQTSSVMTLNMSYALLADSLHPKPEIFIKRTSAFQHSDSLTVKANSFAQSNYTEEILNYKLEEMNNTPLLQTAKWLADIIYTGYISAGKIDFGKIQQFVRITDIEGLRVSLPFRTNQYLWENISVGGSIGLGVKNQVLKYSGMAQYKLPGNKRRIVDFNYTNDYRRIDYNYNDFMFRENPLASGDEDISSSVFGFRSTGKISDRHEYSLSFVNDWNNDIETSVYLRSNKLYANEFLTMKKGNIDYTSLLQNSITVATRFSSDEKTYDDHMQRIYIQNAKPVFYAIVEAGKYTLGETTGNYGRVTTSLKQRIQFDLGQLNYKAEAGFIVGKVPYPLLQIPPGNETEGYNTYRFNLMGYMEYASDKFVNLHSEFVFNGLILKKIPLIRNLNLREIVSLHTAYGSLNESNRTLLDYSQYIHPISKPYTEVGVGLTNIFRIFSLQSVWRLTDLDQVGPSRWGLRGCISISF